MANTTKDLFVFANLDGEFVPAGQLQVDEEGSRLIASSFAYGLRYLDRGTAQEIDPVALSLKNKRALCEIQWVTKFELPTQKINHIDKVRDIAVTTSPSFG